MRWRDRPWLDQFAVGVTVAFVTAIVALALLLVGCVAASMAPTTLAPLPTQATTTTTTTPPTNPPGPTTSLAG